MRTSLVAVGGIKENGDNMNNATGTLIFAAGALLATATARGDVAGSKDNPYQVILDINPFRLKNPPPLTKEPATNVVKLDVRFTGITLVGRTKRAWLVIPPGPGRSQPACLNNLSEGDRDGDLQVVEINEKEDTVKILTGGMTVTLNLKEHGLPAPAGPVVPLPVSKAASSTAPALSVPAADAVTAWTTPYVPPRPVTRVTGSGSGSDH